MLFYNHDKVGMELDVVFNTCKDKTKEGLKGACLACTQDIPNKILWEW